jgi:hypothetical protein
VVKVSILEAAAVRLRLLESREGDDDLPVGHWRTLGMAI